VRVLSVGDVRDVYTSTDPAEALEVRLLSYGVPA
jgi:hypothetical protein